jgi:hypothetical protein
MNEVCSAPASLLVDMANSPTPFPTLAVYLAQFDPTVKRRIAADLEKGLDAGYLAPLQQLEKLIIEPLGALIENGRYRILIILDALDECENRAPESCWNVYFLILGAFPLSESLSPLDLNVPSFP